MPKFKKPKRLKMSKRSEIALDKSIEHWYRVRDENEIVDSCACHLCRLYGGFSCNACPVCKKVGVSGCRITPYVVYDIHCTKVSEPERKQLAQAEIDFLQTCYY